MSDLYSSYEWIDTVKKLHEIAYYTALKGQPFSNFKGEFEIEQMHRVKYSRVTKMTACTNFIFGIAEYLFEGNIKNKLTLENVLAVLYDGSTDKDIKLCVSYFLLFLKKQYVSWLFRTKCFEKKFNLQLFYLLTV